VRRWGGARRGGTQKEERKIERGPQQKETSLIIQSGLGKKNKGRGAAGLGEAVVFAEVIRGGQGGRPILKRQSEPDDLSKKVNIISQKKTLGGGIGGGEGVRVLMLWGKTESKRLDLQGGP